MKRIAKNMGKGDFDMIQIKYDIVGSFLRPEAIKKARAEFKSGAITREDLKNDFLRNAPCHNLKL